MLLKIVVLVCVISIETLHIEAGKYGGSRSRPSPSRPASRPSYPSHRPSPSPSYPSPSHHVTYPSPSHHVAYPSPSSLSYPTHVPAPAPHIPAPASHPKPAQPATVRPIGFDLPTRQGTGSGVQRPTGFDFGHSNGPSQSSGVSKNTGTPSAQPPPYPGLGNHPNQPVGPPKNVGTLSNTPPPYPGFGKPVGFNLPSQSNNPNQPIGPPKNVGANSNAPPPYSGTGTQRPIGFQVPANPGLPVGPPKTVNTQGNVPLSNSGNVHYTSNQGLHPSYNPAGYGAPPAYTHSGHVYNPAGYGQPPSYGSGGYGGYHNYPPSYNTGYQHYPQSGGGVTIVNNNYNHNNNYHGYHGGGYGYGGYGGWHSYPSYSYGTSDVGSGTLGFFLGYSLAKITTPSYHYHSSYYSDYGYTPRYDHYEIHHYYHNKAAVPKEAEIQSNAVVSCVGDTGSFCPPNTYALCTNNGAVMCVASAMTTVPCTNEHQTNCIRTSIPCINNTSPECQNSSKNTSVTLPCISTAKIYANVSFVNNTVIVEQSNGTLQNSTDLNQNNTSTVVNNTSAVISNVTTSAVPSLGRGTNVTQTSASNVTDSTKTTYPQMFCVTILALPAERKPSEAEKLFSGTKNIFSQFAVKALGIA